MTVTVPSTDASNYALQAQVAAVQALVTAAANPALLPNQVQTLKQLQMQLVMSLMANIYDHANYGAGVNQQPSWLDPATVLSTLTINT